MCGGCDTGNDRDVCGKNACTEDCAGNCDVCVDAFADVIIANCPNGKDANTCTCLDDSK